MRCCCCDGYFATATNTWAVRSCVLGSHRFPDLTFRFSLGYQHYARLSLQHERARSGRRRSSFLNAGLLYLGLRLWGVGPGGPEHAARWGGPHCILACVLNLVETSAGLGTPVSLVGRVNVLGLSKPGLTRALVDTPLGNSVAGTGSEAGFPAP